MFLIFFIDSCLSANFIVLVEKLKSYRFVIVEFLDEKSTDVVPSIWISVDTTLQQFICQWPNSPNVSKISSSMKKPLPDWESYICSPRKFFSKFFFF